MNPHLHTAEITDADDLEANMNISVKRMVCKTSEGEYMPLTVIILHDADSHGWQLVAVHFCLRT